MTARLKIRLERLLESTGVPDAELSVLFTGDRSMRALNRRYRGIDRTTDVLSFSQREGAFGNIRPDLLGDIVISVPTAARQARGRGHTFNHELDLLLVHGLLHLLGYDHETGRRDAARMRRKERQLLDVIAD